MNYIKCVDYYLPDLEVPRAMLIGIYGKVRLQYLKHYRRPYYSNLIICYDTIDH